MTHQGCTIREAIVREFKAGASIEALRERWGYIGPDLVEEIIRMYLERNP